MGGAQDLTLTNYNFKHYSPLWPLPWYPENLGDPTDPENLIYGSSFSCSCVYSFMSNWHKIGSLERGNLELCKCLHAFCL